MTGGKCISAKTVLWHLGSLGLQRQPWMAEQKTPRGFPVQNCGGQLANNVSYQNNSEVSAKYKVAQTAKKRIQIVSE